MSKEQRAVLTDYRDANLARLNEGLSKLGFPLPIDSVPQGSHSTLTTVQHLDNDYDIDVGLIFKASDLPTVPLEARKRIQAALLKAGGNFKEDPTVRTNAVTVWYQDNHHVDMAVYRKTLDSYGGETVEHASTDWAKRNPSAFTTWFNDRVKNVSPKKANGATVEENQLRRMVRLSKIFGKTRPSWNFPGGMIMSILVSESYQSDMHRDDLAFVATLNALKIRLMGSIVVYDPSELSRQLTEKPKYAAQVPELLEKLKVTMPVLDVLQDPNCTKLQAIRAWKNFFNHSYWSDTETTVDKAMKQGEQINVARDAAKLSVTPSGKVTTTANGSSIPVKKHNFYGDQGT